VSTNRLPALPGLSVEKVRAPGYSTRTLRAVSGKEVRVAWRASAIVTYRLKFNFLRSTVYAPNETGSGGQDWSAYTELALVKAFHTTHRGSWDSWHLLDPDGGADVTVHFVDDVLSLTQVVPGVWSGELEVESVL
jgi:hypothetical protein